jgi:steroid delta-isomerase-like uncharacterized protein
VSIEENKAIARRYRLEIFSKGNLTLIDELFADKFILHGEETNHEGMKEVMKLWHTAFPDMDVSIEDMIAERDMVVEYFVVRGVHHGYLDLFGGIPPTGNLIEVEGVYIYQINHGKIAEIKGVVNTHELLRQLNVLQL